MGEEITGAALQASQLTLLLQGVVVILGVLLWVRQGEALPATQPRSFPVWRAGWFYIWLLAFLALALIFLSQLVAVQLLAALAPGDGGTPTGPATVLGILSTQGPLLLAYWLFRYRLAPPPQARGDATRAKPSAILWNGLVAFLKFVPLVYLGQLGFGGLLYLVNNWIGDVPLPRQPQPAIQLFLSDPPAWLVVVLVVSAVLLAPVVEEIFFRGGLYRLLREHLGGLSAATISSALFAALHLHLLTFFPIFLLGCLLCFVYERTGRLTAAIVFHALFNAFTMLQLYVLWVTGALEELGKGMGTASGL